MSQRALIRPDDRFDGGGIRLLREVDSARVMINARGPVGLEGLTLLKWVVLGQGEIRR